MRVNVKYNYNF